MKIAVVGCWRFSKHPAGSERNIHNLIHWLRHYGVEVSEYYTTEGGDINDTLQNASVAIFSAWTTGLSELLKTARQRGIFTMIRMHVPKASCMDQCDGILWHNQRQRKIRAGKPDYVLYSIPIPSEIMARTHQRKYLTITNSCPNKGGKIFKEIVKIAHRAKLPYQFLAVKSSWTGKKEYESVDMDGLCKVIDPIPPHELWSITRILIAPAKKESCSNAMIEAAYNGIPCIGINTNSFREIYGPYGGIPLPANATIRMWLMAIKILETHYAIEVKKIARFKHDPRFQPERVKEFILWLNRRL